MMQRTAGNLLDGFFSGDALQTGELLWGALILGLLFAFGHLLTMLVTRWGDSNTTSKALIFSILVHISCALGLVAFNPPQRLKDKLDEEPDKSPIRNVFVESEQQRQSPESGNTPVWQQLSEPSEMQLTRLEKSPLELKPPEAPERKQSEQQAPQVEAPDLPSFPDRPTVTPKPERRGRDGLQAEAVRPMKIDDSTAEARSEVEIPSAALRRQTPVRKGQQTEETPVRRTPKKGRLQRPAPEFQPEDRMVSIEAPSDAQSFLQRAPEQQSIRRRSGPAPSTIAEEEAGMPKEQPGEGASGQAPTRSRFTRLQSRTPQSTEGGGVERLRPERTPQTPDPAGDKALAVREAPSTDFPRPGLKPNLQRPEFDAVRRRKSASIPATYRLRNLARRQEIARKFGGTEASERAVESSLQWLALHQQPEGFWDADEYGSGQVKFEEIDGQKVDRQNAGIKADTGVTALAILAFLGAGYTHEEGRYAEQVDQALDWLIAQQAENGYLGGKATHFAKMYCHAMATYALGEAYGMQSDPTIDTRLRDPLQRAVDYIVEKQNPINDLTSQGGGWRYVEGQPGDMSMFGWQLMALKSAQIAGITIPEKVKERMIHFLEKRSLGEHGGLAGYRDGSPPSASMTAEALFCKQMLLGLDRSSPASQEAIDYLLQHLPKHSELNLYYWYYGTLAVYQYGGRPWRQWNEAMRDQLVAIQRSSGDAAGSWDPKGRWGPYGGRVYSTALGALCLEVYYRFLPLYQMGGRYEAE